jgi:hypothetical protein
MSGFSSNPSAMLSFGPRPKTVPGFPGGRQLQVIDTLRLLSVACWSAFSVAFTVMSPW